MNNWEKDLNIGQFYLTYGLNYINNDYRYNIAFRYLKQSYDKLIKYQPDNHIQLARICLNIGISINENMDISNHIERNNKAISYYKLGLKHLNKSNIDNPTLKMALYNSLGVAYHHKDYSHIPNISLKYYKKAYDIYNQYPKKKEMKDLMKRIAHNSGYKYLPIKGGCDCNKVIEGVRYNFII